MNEKLKEYYRSTLLDMQAKLEIVENNAKHNVDSRIEKINATIYGMLSWESLGEDGLLSDEDILKHIDDVNERYKLLLIE